MSDTTLAVILAALPALLVALANVALIIRQGKALAENTEKTNAVAENVAIIEKATNSMKDALVASTAKAAGLEGHAAGMADAATAAADATLAVRMARVEEILAGIVDPGRVR